MGPQACSIRLPERSSAAPCDTALSSMSSGHFISDHNLEISMRLAEGVPHVLPRPAHDVNPGRIEGNMSDTRSRFRSQLSRHRQAHLDLGAAAGSAGGAPAPRCDHQGRRAAAVAALRWGGVARP